MEKKSLKGIWQVIKESCSGFIDEKILKLGSALAFTTVFSLAPLLIVILYLCGIFFGQEAIQGSIYRQIEGFVGHDSALQLQDMIKNASLEGKGTTAAIIGVITLIIGATSVFSEIQDSINQIWGLKVKPGKSLVQYLKTRLLSFGIIASLGFLLLVSLGITTIIEALSNRLKYYFPDVTVIVIYIINLAVSFLVISLLFSVIYKVLPDAQLKWKEVMAGSITAAALFMLGKFGISFYITKAAVGSTYGAAGSLVVLLIWIYYSAIILYFGAEFSKRYAIKYGGTIRPNKYAVLARTVEIEEKGKSVQAVDKKEKKEEKAN